ncbi:MAG: DUF2807 domain-containing protein [Victivallales bacterium]|nr:DUF2807 domain-containing protein [Victivallales bacterium]
MVLGNRMVVFLCAALIAGGVTVKAQDADSDDDTKKDVEIIKDDKAGAQVKVGSIKSREIKGDGNVVSDSREIFASSYVNINGAFDVEIVPAGGKKTEIQVSADANLLDNLKTVVSGEQLMIYADKPYSSNHKIVISVRMPYFRGLYCEGGSIVNVKNVDADILAMKVLGASSVVLKGKALLMRGELQGAGELNALNLITEKVDLNMSGASKAKVFAVQRLKVSASGAAEIIYAGRPVKIMKDLEGAAELKKYTE